MPVPYSDYDGWEDGDEDIPDPEPESIDDPWWLGQRSDW